MGAMVELVKVTGPTSIHVAAEINEAGDLVLSGQDVGEAPRAMFGDADYEYWLTVRRGQKAAVFRGLNGEGPVSDAALLALLAKRYGGDPLVVSKLRALLEAKGVACEFFSY